MTRTEPASTTPSPVSRSGLRSRSLGSRVLHMVGTTDPKDIALLYLVTAFMFFLIGGAMALLIRGELAAPGLQFLSAEQYNQRFIVHGTPMPLLYATPILFGFADRILPLEIGGPGVDLWTAGLIVSGSGRILGAA